MDLTNEIASSNESDISITETEFYQWIADTGYHPFRGLSVLYYIEDRYSYQIGRDVVSPALRSTLATIHDFYTCSVMHPIWNAERRGKQALIVIDSRRDLAAKALYDETMRTP